MKLRAAAVMLALIAVLVLLLQREEARGTFGFVERPFLSWLAANAGPVRHLPPLTLVLYDEEASALAGGEGPMAMLDGALFTRAASRLGALAAGVEGLHGDPARMIEAAGGMPVFGGFDSDDPPGAGWTPLRGQAPSGWTEMPGLAGRPGVFARGFVSATSAAGGAREIQLMGRSADRPVPSFLVLAWCAAQGFKGRDLSVEDGRVEAPQDRLVVGPRGAMSFLPGAAAPAMSMNELLVASEKFEREGGQPPLRGRVLVLARATADVARVEREGVPPVTPAELWAQSWEALRSGRLFVPAGWWFAPSLIGLCGLLALGPSRRSNRGAAIGGGFAVMVYLLAALGAFAGARIFLPLGPAVMAFAAALLSGRAAHEAGWLGK